MAILYNTLQIDCVFSVYMARARLTMEFGEGDMQQTKQIVAKMDFQKTKIQPPEADDGPRDIRSEVKGWPCSK